MKHQPMRISKVLYICRRCRTADRLDMIKGFFKKRRLLQGECTGKMHNPLIDEDDKL